MVRNTFRDPDITIFFLVGRGGSISTQRLCLVDGWPLTLCHTIYDDTDLTLLSSVLRGLGPNTLTPSKGLQCLPKISFVVDSCLEIGASLDILPVHNRFSCFPFFFHKVRFPSRTPFWGPGPSHPLSRTGPGFRLFLWVTIRTSPDSPVLVLPRTTDRLL